MQIKNFFIIGLLVFALLIGILASCNQNDDDDDNDSIDDDDDDASNGGIKIILVAVQPDQALQITLDDVSSFLRKAFHVPVHISEQIDENPDALNITVNLDDVNDAAFTAAESNGLPAESFRLRTADFNGQTIIAVLGADGRGTQFALYHLLEMYGFRFFHPEQTFIPQIDQVAPPENLDVYEAPDWQRRGFHIHTMHPLPHTEFLMRDDPAYLEYSKNLIDWHVRNKQNYMQFELLRTVDYDATLDHFNAWVDYGHTRLMDMGIVITWVFMQQKAWRIVPDMRHECKEEMEANLDQIMQVPWDHINLEMGSSEFTEVVDTTQVAWMNNTVVYLGENYPDTEASVKVHCSSGQVAEHYGNINFNYLAQEADPRMGVYPHTVQFYDLQGPAPAYDNEDFGELLAWMEQILGTRKMYYYPETAYWCSWDIDVPLFLPVYLFNRYKDVVLLTDWDLDGHVNFTSGHEWGYWINDWTLARYVWDSDQEWTDALALITDIFGDAGPTLYEALHNLTLYQEDTLIGYNLAPYLAGFDTWDELGYMLGSTTHPMPIMFSELYRMSAQEIYNFHDTVLLGLENLNATYQQLLENVKLVENMVPENAMDWYRELVDCFQVNAYRSDHAFQLNTGVAYRRLHELGVLENGEQLAQEHFAEALAITPQFLDLMRQREAEYRYPVFLSSGWQRSLTSYDYRFLWQASTGYWYRRYEKQAIDKNFNPLLDNVVDPFWFLF